MTRQSGRQIAAMTLNAGGPLRRARRPPRCLAQFETGCLHETVSSGSAGVPRSPVVARRGQNAPVDRRPAFPRPFDCDDAGRPTRPSTYHSPAGGDDDPNDDLARNGSEHRQAVPAARYGPHARLPTADSAGHLSVAFT